MAKARRATWRSYWVRLHRQEPQSPLESPPSGEVTLKGTAVGSITLQAVTGTS